jgi:hypothetical protein
VAQGSQAIPCLEAVQAGRFGADFVQAGRPAVLPGAVPNPQLWAARATVASIYGGPPRDVESFISLDALRSPAPASFSEATALVQRLQDQEPESWHLATRMDADTFGILFPQAPVPDVLDGVRLEPVWVLAGSQTYTRLHFHLADHAVLCQLEGRKKVVLYPPGATPFMHPYPPYHADVSVSRHDPACPDGRYPLPADSRAEVTLRPGDALYIPIGWWHSVRSTASTTSIVFFWAAHLRHLPAGTASRSLLSLALRNPVGLARWLWRGLIHRSDDLGAH